MDTIKLLQSRAAASGCRRGALAGVAAGLLALAPMALSAAERPDIRVAAAVAAPVDLSAKGAAQGAAPAQGSALRALDDEAAAASAVPTNEATPNVGALGLALLALVLWVGMRLNRRD